MLATWKVRFELRDSLQIRESSELNKMRRMLRDHRKKESKKSIMDIFSKFLNSKDSDQEEEENTSASPTIWKKRNHLMNYSQQVLTTLIKNEEGRAKAAESIMLNIMLEEARRFEEFIACLFLIFYMANGENGTTRNDCVEICLSLLEEIFGMTESSISLRIANLKAKMAERHE